MITPENADRLETITGQLEAIYGEISVLVKKAPNDGVNRFKFNIVNSVISKCNEVLGQEYRPIGDFAQLESDPMPSNSDVTFVLSQYLNALERLRSDNISQDDHDFKWYYDFPEGESEHRTAVPPKRPRS